MTPIAWLRVGMYAGIAAVALAAFFGYRAHVEQLGEAKIETADALALAAQHKVVIARMLRDKGTNQESVDGLRKQNADLAARLAAVSHTAVRLCQPAAYANSGRVPTAGAATAGPERQPASSGSGVVMQGRADQGADIGPGLLVLAAVAEAVGNLDRHLLERDRKLAAETP